MLTRRSDAPQRSGVQPCSASLPYAPVQSRTLAVAVAALLTVAARRAPSRSSRRRATRRSTRPVPPGRYLMDGTWLFKLDNHQSGPQLESGIAGWKQVTVPNAWNVGDDSDAVVPGRRRLVPQGLQAPDGAPSAASWVVRFESVNYRSKVWLNGKPIGKNRGAYLPFEIRLPAGPAQARRRQPPRHPGRHRAASRPTSRPRACPSWASRRAAGGTTAACCARSTCARSTTSTSTRSSSGPNLPCATCAATVTYRVTLRNYGAQAAARRASARASAARRVTIGTDGDRRQALRDAAPSRSRSTSRACGRRPARTSTTRPLAVRSGGRPAAALHAEDRHPLDQGRRRPPVPQRRAR